MPDALLALLMVWPWNSQYSRNQSAMFALLASVKKAHHQASGFDRVCQSNLMRYFTPQWTDTEPSQ